MCIKDCSVVWMLIFGNNLSILIVRDLSKLLCILMIDFLWLGKSDIKYYGGFIKMFVVYCWLKKAICKIMWDLIYFF